jgi:hypothetical protein
MESALKDTKVNRKKRKLEKIMMDDKNTKELSAVVPIKNHDIGIEQTKSKKKKPFKYICIFFRISYISTPSEILIVKH